MNLEARLQEVRDEYLRRATQGDNPLLREVLSHVTARCGKMLRPKLTLLAAATRGDEVFRSRRTLLLAVVVEMLHNASLIHDDVIDCADSRRGQPSVNARWSNSVAVLVGDYLLATIMSILDELNDNAAATLVNRTVKEMVQSELLQLQLGADPAARTAEQYLAVIDGKTARLFATACALGNPDYEDFGLHYGRLFQLRDDIDDHEDTPLTALLLQQEEQALAAMNKTLAVEGK